MINNEYKKLILSLKHDGNYVVTRGAGVRSIFGYYFGEVRGSLVTIRKTAWKTALKELEWYMSGQDKCPEGTLSDIWWKGQLSPDGKLRQGYPAQLRRSICSEGVFDQVAWLRNELKEHPSSRRMILTVWNSGTMAAFTDINQNPMAPTCCHLTLNQFQVRNGELQMNATFRSIDAILGLPHNLVQHRALQLYFAHHAGVPAAAYYKLFINDVHYYDHPDHNSFVDFLDSVSLLDLNHDLNDLIYTPTDLEFKASDFQFKNPIPEPIYSKAIQRTL